MSANDKVSIKGEVAVVFTRHKPSCFLMTRIGSQLPEEHCDCGAVLSRYGRDVIVSPNLITNDGDRFYAELVQRGAFEALSIGATITPLRSYKEITVFDVAPTGGIQKTTTAADFVTTIVSGANKPLSSGYPKVNDTDVNNPGTVGVDILTWKFQFGVSDANYTNPITHIAIHETGATFGSGSTDTLLNATALASSRTKTSSDTMTIYANHNFLG